ncbi:hypothetical protein ODJ79_04970 [Actinoplanes sp. KI2]|uniref:hypothetical protein n=1 Tax=Actinoplanes sp. KI2 TaxID=2983315 RepID=UPI0021D5E086|nr:hypothetical protein [Actinoplanes sp. KI2]MCU7723058.1 hypothetical protein [Actinoplanes sp. KI2]
MNQFVDNAYVVASNLFGPESGIPWWVWVFAVGAIAFKLFIPVPKTARDLANEHERRVYEDLVFSERAKGGRNGKKAKKRKR